MCNLELNKLNRVPDSGWNRYLEQSMVDNIMDYKNHYYLLGPQAHLKKNWGGGNMYVLLVGPLILCFRLLVMSPLGFKARVDSFICTWWKCICYTFLRFTSGATPADVLVTSMAAKLVSSTYLQAGIGGARNWDLLCHRWMPYRLSYWVNEDT